MFVIPSVVLQFCSYPILYRLWALWANHTVREFLSSILFLWLSSTPVPSVRPLTVQLFDPLLFLRRHYGLLLLRNKDLSVDFPHKMAMFLRLRVKVLVLRFFKTNSLRTKLLSWLSGRLNIFPHIEHSNPKPLCFSKMWRSHKLFLLKHSVRVAWLGLIEISEEVI